MNQSSTKLPYPPSGRPTTPVTPAADAVQPITALSVVETLSDGFQQLTESQRVDLLFDPSCAPGIAEAAKAAAERIAAVEDCPVMSESQWWRASSAPGSSGSPAFDRARAAAQRELGEVA